MSAPKGRGKVIVNFEVTPEEREQVQENAAWFQMTMSEFLRHAALGGTLDIAHHKQREHLRRHRRRVAA